MKKYIIIFTLLTSVLSFGQLSINEVSYYTTPQFIEINGPTNFNLTSSGWQLKFYKGNGQLITTENLTGTLPSTSVFPGENKSLLAFDTSSISYSSPPGGYVALINPSGTAIELFAFQGGVPRVVGGLTSTDIGSAVSGESIQKTDTGWISATPTKGLPTAVQTTLPVEKNEIKGFKLFPTVVADGRFSITTNNSQVKKVQIYSILGSLVYEKQVQPYENVNIQNLSTGLYFVLVEENRRVSVKKILVN